MIHYSLIGYMLASAIIMIVCVMAYRLLFENKVSPSINRLILLSIYAVSFIVPLLVALIPASYGEIGIELSKPEFAGMVGNVNGEPEKNTLGLSEVLLWISLIYFFGLFLTFLYSLMTIGHLVILLRNTKTREIEGTTVYVHKNKKLSSFSWFNKIFLYEESLNSDFKDLKMLVSHEKAHLDRGHWIDLALAQVVLIFQWFNPVVWFMRKELQRIHEYEADEAVLHSGIDEKDYQMLLIQNISGNRYSGLTDGLNNCSLKKRIIMMKKTKFKKDWVTRGIAVCGFAILGGLIIHIPAVANVLETQPESEPSKHLTVLSASSVPKSEAENIFVANEESMKDATIIIDGKESTYDEMIKLDPGSIDNITILKDSKIIVTLKKGEEGSSREKSGNDNGLKVIGYGTIKKDNNLKADNQSDIQSNVVDQPDILAEYEGGSSQLLTDLSNSVRYPLEAYEKGIQGRVVVRFRINTNGTISDCEVAYSQNPLLNEAAIKGVEDLPGKWIPAKVDGKPVTSIFNMPVTFKLTGPESK